MTAEQAFGERLQALMRSMKGLRSGRPAECWQGEGSESGGRFVRCGT